MPAAIDVGTNTVRLLVGDISDERVRPRTYRRQITRLGGGYSKEKGLAPDAMERTLLALRDFSDVLRDSGAPKVRAVGTQALRQAVNGDLFVDRVRRQTGLVLEIISGEEEAQLCAAGVLGALEPVPESCLVFDIGGGSTEFMLLRGGKIDFCRSYPLGVVRLCEGFVGEAERSQAVGQVLDALKGDLCQADLLPEGNCPLVGTAGTVTTLAALDLEMTEYDWRRINNHSLSRSRLESLIETLKPLSVEERERLPGMEAGRGDLIQPGAELVMAILARFGMDRLTVSDFGLLEGTLLSISR